MQHSYDTIVHAGSQSFILQNLLPVSPWCVLLGAYWQGDLSTSSSFTS